MKRTYLAATLGAAAVLLAACVDGNDPLAPHRTLVPNAASRTALGANSTEPKTGSIYTSQVGSCAAVNGNVFASKADVAVNGGPHNDHAGSGLPDGYYAVRVTDPSGHVLLGTTVGTTDEAPP